MRPLLLPLPGNEAFARALSAHLDAEMGRIEYRRFPDGESYVRFQDDLRGRDSVIVSTLDRPDNKLLPLLFSARTAKELGAACVGLVCPYLAYMRQDRRFNKGEAVTSSQFATLLSGLCDWLVTVDPHLHRRSSLSEIYSIPTRALHAAPLIGEWIAANIPRPLLIGPDAESEQWVSQIAAASGSPFLVLRKVRHGDRDVEITLPSGDALSGRTPVLADDIISTARTMVETVHRLRELSEDPPVCIGVHAIFAERAYEELLAQGASQVLSCNTVAHPSNAIDVSPIVARAVRELLGDSS